MENGEYNIPPIRRINRTQIRAKIADAVNVKARIDGGGRDRHIVENVAPTLRLWLFQVREALLQSWERHVLFEEVFVAAFLVSTRETRHGSVVESKHIRPVLCERRHGQTLLGD